MKSMHLRFLALVFAVLFAGCDGWSEPDDGDIGQLASVLESSPEDHLRFLSRVSRARQTCSWLTYLLFDSKADGKTRSVPAMRCGSAEMMPSPDSWIPVAFSREQFKQLCGTWDGTRTVELYFLEQMAREMNAQSVDTPFGNWRCASDDAVYAEWKEGMTSAEADFPDPVRLEEEESLRKHNLSLAIINGLLASWLLVGDVVALIPTANEALRVIQLSETWCALGTGNGECDPNSPYYAPPGGDQ